MLMPFSLAHAKQALFDLAGQICMCSCTLFVVAVFIEVAIVELAGGTDIANDYVGDTARGHE